MCLVNVFKAVFSPLYLAFCFQIHSLALSCICCPVSIKYEFKSLKNRPQTECKFRAPTLLGVHLDVVEMLGGEAGGVGALQLAVRVLQLAVGTLQLAVGTFQLAVGTL